MPLEINKLQVKVSVNQAKSEGGEGSSASPSVENAGKKGNVEKMAQDIIEQIVTIMENKDER